MNKKAAVGLFICVIGAVLLSGSVKTLPDLKPVGAAMAVILLGAAVAVPSVLNKKGNAKMYLGTVLCLLGLVSAFATIDSFPDYKPFGAMVFAFLVGAALYTWGITGAKISISPRKINVFNLFGALTAFGLLVISVLLLALIDWQHPKDPAGVMMLAAFSALLIIYALLRDHAAKKPVVWAGFIALANFILIPAYEAGLTDFLGRFYRLFVPLYASFDLWAETIEYSLITVTIVLAIIMAAKRVRVRDYGNATLWFFMLMPLMAIFLFEMMGLPAGFLAGLTTRSDLLVTDTNAAMSTIGILFIAVAMYMVFELFPFWVAPILAGLWWVFWKPWLLHHPNPAMWPDLAAFWPAGKFLFLTGMKRVVLPMILVILVLNAARFGKPFHKLRHP